VRALVGENGDGKSTLLKIIAAATMRDAGEMRLDGAAYSPTDMGAAQRRGVALVFQEITINPSLGIAENIFIDRLGKYAGRFGLLDRPKLNRDAQEILDSMGAGFSVTDELTSLDLGQFKMIEIARALSYQPQVLLLDESTAFLNTREVSAFLDVVRNLRGRGIACGFVSHHLEEVGRVADTITILKDGRKVGDYRESELDPKEIETLMVGRETANRMYPAAPIVPPDVPLLELRDVSVAGRLAEVSLAVGAGEIVALGGLKGSGGEVILEVMYGETRPTAGAMQLAGAPYQPSGIVEACRAGIAYLPGDRLGEGLIAGFSVLENINLGVSPHRGPFIDHAAAREIADHYISELHITAASPDAPSDSLSGGNLQKVVLARCMAVKPRVLLLNNPTRGIDVGSRTEIYRLIRLLADGGTAIVMLSDDLPELIGMADRIFVTKLGRVTKVFSRAEQPREEDIITHMI
ncbi:MAG: sugar ABC transporter ATP-binding protein, partial [Chloroflexota bacterium]